MKRFLFAFMAALGFSVASAQPASDVSVILAKMVLATRPVPFLYSLTGTSMWRFAPLQHSSFTPVQEQVTM